MGLAKWSVKRHYVEAGFKPGKNAPILLEEGARGKGTWGLGEEVMGGGRGRTMGGLQSVPCSIENYDSTLQIRCIDRRFCLLTLYTDSDSIVVLSSGVRCHVSVLNVDSLDEVGCDS